MTSSIIRFSVIIKFAIYFFIISCIAVNNVDCQHPFENSTAAQVSNKGQQLLNDPVQSKKKGLNEDQQVPEKQVQHGEQTPFLSKTLNVSQISLVGETKNLSRVLQTTQSPNDAQVSNTTQLLNETQSPDDILNPFIKSASDLFTDSISFTFTNSLKYFQKMFFDDMEEDAIMAIKSGLKPNVSYKCLKSLEDLLVGLSERKRWAWRMIDSFGKIPNGVLDGTLSSFGDFDMCVNTIIPEFQGRYCLVGVSPVGSVPNPPLKPMNISFVFDTDFTKSLDNYDGNSTVAEFFITTSICLPSKCSDDEVQNILSKVASYSHQSIELKAKQCSLKHELTLNSTQSKILFIILALIIFELFATYLDVKLRNLHGEQFDESKLTRTTQCILAFSFYSNTIRLFKKDENPDSVKIFHGIKVISIAWVILGHNIAYFGQVLGRLHDLFLYWSEFFFQILINGLLTVETFFFMSGFLVVYTFVKANSVQLNFFLFAFYRIMRLLPPVLFIIGLLLVAENLSSGPFWKEYVSNLLIGSCKTNWWMSLLFINNILEMTDLCLPWTWHISGDMQLYLMSYPLLLLIRRNPQRALLVLKGIIVASVIGSMYYQAAYNLPPHPVLIYIHFQDRNHFTRMLHIFTHNHITPYCMGMIMGYFIATKKKIHLSKTQKFFGWCMAITFFLICIFTTYVWNHRGRIATLTESVLYGGTYRLLWSVMLSWVVYLCLNGEAGKIKSILSADVFVPFARLTYIAFLVHPLVQVHLLGQLRHLFSADIKILMYAFLGFLTVVYMFAYVTCLICESPFSRLLSILISSKYGKSHKE